MIKELRYNNLQDYPLYAIYNGVMSCVGYYEDMINIKRLIKNNLDIDITNARIKDTIKNNKWQVDTFADGLARLYVSEIHLNDDDIIDLCLEVCYKEVQ